MTIVRNTKRQHKTISGLDVTTQITNGTFVITIGGSNEWRDYKRALRFRPNGLGFHTGAFDGAFDIAMDDLVDIPEDVNEIHIRGYSLGGSVAECLAWFFEPNSIPLRVSTYGAFGVSKHKSVYTTPVYRVRCGCDIVTRLFSKLYPKKIDYLMKSQNKGPFKCFKDHTSYKPW